MNTNLDGGDALLKLAGEITGEASLLRYSDSVPTTIKDRTSSLAGTIVAAVDGRIDANFEAHLRHWLPRLSGGPTVRADVAPLFSGKIGPFVSVSQKDPSFAIANSGNVVLQFDVYDAAKGISRESNGMPMWIMSVAPMAHMSSADFVVSMRNDSNVCLRVEARRVADVTPVATEIKGEVGDRFERMGEWALGKMFDVTDILPNALRVLDSESHTWLATVDQLRDPSLFRFISSAADRAKAAPVDRYAAVPPEEVRHVDGLLQAHADRENGNMAVQPPDDIDGPAGDERIAFTIPDAVKALQAIVESVDRFTRAWAAFSVEDGATFEQVDAAARELSELAGFKVPFIRKPAAPPMRVETPGLVHVQSPDGDATMCTVITNRATVAVVDWREKATCHACRIACGSLPRGGR